MIAARPAPKPILAAIVLSGLAACAPTNDLKKPPVPLGRFLLGVNVSVAEGAQVSPVSRKATDAEWEDALKQAVSDRFGRYDGDKYYDISTKVLGYALAPPGIPVLLAPKSVLIIEVRLYDDATQTLLDDPPKTFTVFEGTSGATIVGSGLVRTKAEQIKLLSFNAVKQIEDWLVKNPKWFPTDPDAIIPGTKPAEVAPPSPAAAPGKPVAKPGAKPAAKPLAKPRINLRPTRRRSRNLSLPRRRRSYRRPRPHPTDA